MDLNSLVQSYFQQISSINWDKENEKKNSNKRKIYNEKNSTHRIISALKSLISNNPVRRASAWSTLDGTSLQFDSTPVKKLKSYSADVVLCLATLLEIGTAYPETKLSIMQQQEEKREREDNKKLQGKLEEKGSEIIADSNGNKSNEEVILSLSVSVSVSVSVCIDELMILDLLRSISLGIVNGGSYKSGVSIALINSLEKIIPYLTHPSSIIQCITIDVLANIENPPSSLIETIISLVDPILPQYLRYFAPSASENKFNAPESYPPYTPAFDSALHWVDWPSAQLYRPSLYAMNAVTKLNLIESEVRDKVFDLCKSNLSHEFNCHPRIALQSSYILLLNLKEEAPANSYKFLILNENNTAFWTDSYLDTELDDDDFLNKIVKLSAELPSAPLVEAGIGLITPSPPLLSVEQGFGIMTSLLTKSFKSKPMLLHYPTVDSIEDEKKYWKMNENGERKYKREATFWAKPGFKIDVEFNLPLTATDLNEEQRQLISAFINSPLIQQIQTNIFGYYRLPNDMKELEKLLIRPKENALQSEKDMTPEETAIVTESSVPPLSALPTTTGTPAMEPEATEKEGNEEEKEEIDEEDELFDPDYSIEAPYAGKEPFPPSEISDEPTRLLMEIASRSAVSSDARTNFSLTAEKLLQAAVSCLTSIDWFSLTYKEGRADNIPYFIACLTHPIRSVSQHTLWPLEQDFYETHLCFKATPFIAPYLTDLLHIAYRYTNLQHTSSFFQSNNTVQSNATPPNSASNSLLNDPKLRSSDTSCQLLPIRIAHLPVILQYLVECSKTNYLPIVVKKGYKSAFFHFLAAHWMVYANLLKSNDKEVVELACQLLGDIKEKAEDIIPLLISVIRVDIPVKYPFIEKEKKEEGEEEGEKEKEETNEEEEGEISQSIRATTALFKLSGALLTPAAGTSDHDHDLTPLYSLLLPWCTANVNNPTCHPRIKYQAAVILLSYYKEESSASAIEIVVQAFRKRGAIIFNYSTDEGRDYAAIRQQPIDALKGLGKEKGVDALLAALGIVEQQELNFDLVKATIGLVFDSLFQYDTYGRTMVGRDEVVDGEPMYHLVEYRNDAGRKLSEEEQAVIRECQINPLKADDLNEKQQQVIAIIVNNDLAWAAKTNFYEQYKLPNERTKWRQLVLERETERLAPSIATAFSSLLTGETSIINPEDDTGKSLSLLESCVRLDHSHPQIVALCQLVFAHPKCQPRLAYLSAYCLLSALKGKASEEIIDDVVNGYAHREWLMCHEDWLTGSSTARIIGSSLPLPLATSVLLKAIKLSNDPRQCVAAVDYLLSLYFTRLPLLESNSPPQFSLEDTTLDRGQTRMAVYFTFSWPHAETDEEIEVFRAQRKALKDSIPAEEELTDAQAEVISSLLECEPVWEVGSNVFEIYHLPNERVDLREKTVMKRESEKWIPALIPLIDCTSEQSIPSMRQLSRLNKSDPRLIQICQANLSGEVIPEIAYLSSYCLICHMKQSTSPEGIEKIVEGFSHPDWLVAHQDIDLGFSPAKGLSLLARPQAVSSLISPLASLALTKRIARTIASTLISLAFTRYPYGQRSPLLTAAELTDEQRVILLALSDCSVLWQPDPEEAEEIDVGDAEGEEDDFNFLLKHKIPPSRGELKRMLLGDDLLNDDEEGENANQDGENIDVQEEEEEDAED